MNEFLHSRQVGEGEGKHEPIQIEDRRAHVKRHQDGGHRRHVEERTDVCHDSNKENDAFREDVVSLQASMIRPYRTMQLRRKSKQRPARNAHAGVSTWRRNVGQTGNNKARYTRTQSLFNPRFKSFIY